MSKESDSKGETSILRKVADYCWSNNFLDIFRKFFKDHAVEFADAPPLLQGGEHNLVYYSLFQEYLQIYEDTLTTYLNTLDCSIEDFYREVRAAQHDSHEEYVQYFIDCLLASADYDSFYKVMSRHGNLAKKSGQGSSTVPPKADSKQTTRKPPSKKCADDDEEDEDYDVKKTDSKSDSK